MGLATGIPVLLAAYWIVWLAGWLWRGAVWSRAGTAITATASALSGDIVPLWWGWRVQTPDRRVDWVGGLLGQRTRFRTAAGKQVVPDLLDADAVLNQLRS